MRILLLTTELLGRGGVQLAGRLIVSALREIYGNALELHAVTVNDYSSTATEPSLPLRSFAGGGRSRVATACRGASALRRQEWDLVILGHLNLAPLLLAAGGRVRAPVLAMIYGVEAWRRLSWPKQWGLRRADLLAYVSHHSRRAAESANPWLATLPASICHLALPPDADVPPPLLEGNPDRDYALTIGRMHSGERYKGFEELIRIWPRVRAARPNLELVLVGDGDDRQRLEAIAAQVGPGIHFTGAISDAERDAWLGGCRCFCMPSRGEGFGLAYLEAMRFAKPVLAGNGDAGQEVVEDGVTGRTVDARDDARLLDAILDVSGDSAQSYGLAGRERWRGHFSFAAFSERLQALIGSAIALRPRHARFARHSWPHSTTGRPVHGG